MTDPTPRRYAIVGTGHRSELYIDAILGEQAGVAELVALLDPSTTRADYYARRAAAEGVQVSVFHPDQLSAVILEQRIDRVIVTTPDVEHAKYIDIALRAGADVVVEKPLTIDEARSRIIARAVEETGREVVVTFNYRYSPRNAALRQIVQSGEIGKVTAVHFEWVLDTAHGADYFRRWHRDKASSGGLLVHKASHHFDLVNWWINDVPSRVFASGGLRFYGAANARDRGLVDRPERGTHDGPSDAFQLDLRNDPRLAALYLDAEHEDGYRRDLDVFSGPISIEDTTSLLVDYAGGPSMSYSLVAYSPWEGYKVSITGTEGRAELEVVERAAVLTDGSIVLDPSFTPDDGGANDSRSVSEKLVVQRHWGPARTVSIESGEGGHGGGDALLMSDIFIGPSDDSLGRPATWRDGIRSIAVGIAGNMSLETGLPVTIADLDLGIDLVPGARSRT
jgi:predicted dehydrogenase